ncbi:MAG: hypothetical protein KDA44_06065 [Planctomycetales bacterium]|nr:hypothetical protein [Planctomycetales bacterium]
MRILLTAILVATFSQTTLAALLVDDFSVGPTTVTRNGAALAQSQTGLDPSRVLGGARHFEFDGNGADVQTATIGGGTLQLTPTPMPVGNSLAYLDLTWGSDSSPLGLDLTSLGANRFHIDLLSGSRPGLVIGSPGGGRSSRNPDSNGDVFFTELSGSADLANVSWIRLSTVRSSGYKIGSLSIVPEPATLWLGMAAAAVAVHVRLKYVCLAIHLRLATKMGTVKLPLATLLLYGFISNILGETKT